MKREDALSQLNSPSTHARLKAARHLAKCAEIVDLTSLRVARSAETDFYVRGSLERAIDRLTTGPTVQPPDSTHEVEISDRERRHIYARATEWIAGLFLHEIASPLGLLAYEASREVPGYEQSKTKNHIKTLQMVFDAIEQLRKASATPKPIEINLPSLIEEIVLSEFANTVDSIALHGQKPLLLVCDPALLRFSICNGLRNAVEAVSTITGEAWPIVVTWGQTDVDYWISIIDKGPGMTKPVETMLGIGMSTKEGHSGFGLPIAAAAIDAIGGTIRLEVAAGGGTKYELRWER